MFSGFQQMFSSKSFNYEVFVYHRNCFWESYPSRHAHQGFHFRVANCLLIESPVFTTFCFWPLLNMEGIQRVGFNYFMYLQQWFPKWTILHLLEDIEISRGAVGKKRAASRWQCHTWTITHTHTLYLKCILPSLYRVYYLYNNYCGKY